MADVSRIKQIKISHTHHHHPQSWAQIMPVSQSTSLKMWQQPTPQ